MSFRIFQYISVYFRSKGWLLKVAIPCSKDNTPFFFFQNRGKSGKSLKRLLFVQWLGSSQHSCVSEPRHCTKIGNKTTASANSNALVPVAVTQKLPQNYLFVTSELPVSYL